MAETSQGPFASSAWIYREAGWPGVIPIGRKPGEKHPPPVGYTGHEGIDPSGADIQTWIEGAAGNLNVAIHLPPDVYVLDVDTYGEKNGAASLAELAEQLGPLPPTWSSTARGAGSPSRHLLFRAQLPAGRVWLDHPGVAIESLHTGHRYAMVWPSAHPSGTVTWYDPDGEAYEGVPEKEWLPDLPPEWVLGCSQEGSIIPGSAVEWEAAAAAVKAFRDGDACPRVDAALAGELARIARADTEGLHEPGAIHPLVCYGVEGHAGVRAALERHHHAHVEARMRLRGTSKGVAVAEWQRMVQGSIGKKLKETEGEIATSCSCDEVDLTFDDSGIEAEIKEPQPHEVDYFTDAHLSAVLARELFADAYVFTKGLGWLRWSGKVWKPVEPESVTTAVSNWVKLRHSKASMKMRKASGKDEARAVAEVKGWFGYLSGGKIHSIMDLAKGIVIADAADFDRHHDLLNTPAGVLDMRTGESLPHDPRLYLTKMTAVEYKPGAHDEAFKAALGAIPDGACDWMQVALGQGCTGHASDRMMMLTGGGSNGKTVLMNAMYRALGGYAEAVPSVLLLSSHKSKGSAATPEKMTLRGVRFAYVEETPEGRHLDVNALKELVDTPVVKGRELYQSFVTFDATHTLVLNTNYPPVVNETDDGTWRRLLRVEFQHRYRCLPDEKGEWLAGDRQGDAGIKRKLREKGAQEAALAWVVEGARRWYELGQTLAGTAWPDAVATATRTWRHKTDMILRFMEEIMEFDVDSWVPSVTLYRAFAAWAKERGYAQPPAQNTFNDRLLGHTALPGPVAITRKEPDAPGLSLPSEWLGDRPAGKRWTGVVGLRFADSAADLGF